VIGRVLPVLGPQALHLSGHSGTCCPDPARARVCTVTLGLFALSLAVAPGSAACGWLAAGGAWIGGFVLYLLRGTA
jgi:hypothetical protein